MLRGQFGLSNPSLSPSPRGREVEWAAGRVAGVRISLSTPHSLLQPPHMKPTIDIQHFTRTERHVPQRDAENGF